MMPGIVCVCVSTVRCLIWIYWGELLVLRDGHLVHSVRIDGVDGDDDNSVFLPFHGVVGGFHHLAETRGAAPPSVSHDRLIAIHIHLVGHTIATVSRVRLDVRRLCGLACARACGLRADARVDRRAKSEVALPTIADHGRGPGLPGKRVVAEADKSDKAVWDIFGHGELRRDLFDKLGQHLILRRRPNFWPMAMRGAPFGAPFVRAGCATAAKFKRLAHASAFGDAVRVQPFDAHALLCWRFPGNDLLARGCRSDDCGPKLGLNPGWRRHLGVHIIGALHPSLFLTRVAGVEGASRWVWGD